MESVHTEERHGLKIKIFQDESAESPDSWGDDALFLVHYHRDFEVCRDKVVTKETIAELYRGERSEAVKELLAGFYVFPVSALIHSGVWLSLESSFMCDPGGWDTSHVGAVLASKKDFKRKFKAMKAAESLIKEWNDFLSGNVYGYQVEDAEGSDLDSCWGFFGDYNAPGGALSEAQSLADSLTHNGGTDEKGQHLMPFLAVA